MTDETEACMSGWDVPQIEIEFIFHADKGTRVLRFGFWGIQVMDGPNQWWSEQGRKWSPTGLPYPSSNRADCRSFKAFKRHIRHHRELAGHRVRLVSNYIGYCIEAIIPETNNDRD